MGEILFKAIACGLAALLAWVICEPSAPQALVGQDWNSWEIKFIFLLICAIGLTAGLVDGWRQGGKLHLLRGAGLGLLFGAIFGGLGYSLGSNVFQALMSGRPPMGWSMQLMIARTFAFLPMGAFLGAGVGLANFNIRRMIAGLVGGALGGALAGGLFDFIGMMAVVPTQAVRGGSEVGSIPRAVFAVLLGASIGLFTALIDRLSRRAWLKLILGRNEGKEWPVDAVQTFIGRSEKAHVPLFGDQNVMPMHCLIVRQAGHYMLVDSGAPIGVGLNGQRIMGQAPLKAGDTIHVGPFNLVFMMRGGSSPASAPEPGRGYYTPAPAQPVSTQTVAFPAAQQTTLTLVAMTGPLTGQRFPVSGPMEAGRESADIRLGFDSMASRRHASLVPGADGITVTDLGSTNGTLINGQRVTTSVARRGDEIQIGSTVFRLE